MRTLTSRALELVDSKHLSRTIGQALGFALGPNGEDAVRRPSHQNDAMQTSSETRPVVQKCQKQSKKKFVNHVQN
jgi:hypothetical protein